MNKNRAEIRSNIRSARNKLTKSQQKSAASSLKVNFTQHLKQLKTAPNLNVGIYLTNDGELDTSLLIKELWNKNHLLHLPIIHPFNGTTLLFQRYEKNSPMRVNRYGIFEPKLNCAQICPVAELDMLLMPLVAFDDNGNRLGMGGGYYDKTLASLYQQNSYSPQLIGLAHDCQKVDRLPIEAWDVPLTTIITPSKTYQW
ncbi:5-formyltetrahydrofolate cyclo-ligase [Pseudoalteromonas sp. MMG010]|uniref:5-formyltetrahydrofolate cyclo-ligase n=1 Tax=Pseudoalteromonas sp. MMG010 TaxID=2822685 RepID=UPI001B39D3CD|nr:5-formyltetrahydrofolate cyclo-ligase [Pseudoalteromonas sp. MMG010]MBQ4831978.1 5-formyltetrahydrofolate cyclo-ligase [Pseudoalteromonas sp. MMG010]